MSVHDYGLNFKTLSRYAPKMVKDMKRKMILFVASFGRASRKKVKNAMLIGDMDIPRLVVYVLQVEKDKMRDRGEYRNNKAKTEMSLVNIRVVKSTTIPEIKGAFTIIC